MLQLPVFPLQAITRLEASGARPEPAVVTEAVGRQSRIVAANAAAREALIQPGMTLAQARSRAAELCVHTRQRDAEAAAMGLLFALAYQHTPRIERTGPGLLTLDLRGARIEDHLSFGLRCREEAAAHGLDLHLGIAPLPDLARFTACTATTDQPIRQSRQDAASLAQLPLAVTGMSGELRELLGQLGLRHLGDFLNLAPAEVSRRFGAEALAIWEGASGARLRLLEVAEPPRRFQLERELEYRVETLEPLLFLLRRFLDQLEAQLRAASQHASHLELQLQLERAPPLNRRFQLPEPTQRSELLFRVLHLHLEQVRTEQAIVGVGLELTPIDPPHRQRGLFHTSLKDPWRFTDTQSQLVGLVGHERVGRPVLLDTHQPDRFRLEPLLEEVPPLAPLAAERASQRTGPVLRRQRPPLPARVWRQAGRPCRLESAEWRGVIVRTHGPFHLSGDWWQRDTAWRLAEWDVELADGTALRLMQTPAGWQLAGVYD